MLVLQANNKQFNLPTEWRDISHQKLVDSRVLIKQMPDKLSEVLFPKPAKEGKEPSPPEITDKDDIDFIEFYRKYVAFWCGMTDEESYGLLIDDDDTGLGLTTLFNNLKLFMYQADEKQIPPRARFDYEGVTYGLTPSKNVMGQDMPLRGSLAGEYIESALARSLWEEWKKGTLDRWTLLTAILYRPVSYKTIFGIRYGRGKVDEYNGEEVLERAELFKGLTMDKVWASMFFFLQQKLTFPTSTQGFSKRKGSAMLLHLYHLRITGI